MMQSTGGTIVPIGRLRQSMRGKSRQSEVSKVTQPVDRRPNLILASASPRRRSLLESLGLEFRVIPPDFDEEGVSGQAPDDLVAALARGKALAVAKNNPGALV